MRFSGLLRETRSGRESVAPTTHQEAQVERRTGHEMNVLTLISQTGNRFRWGGFRVLSVFFIEFWLLLDGFP